MCEEEKKTEVGRQEGRKEGKNFLGCHVVCLKIPRSSNKMVMEHIWEETKLLLLVNLISQESKAHEATVRFPVCNSARPTFTTSVKDVSNWQSQLCRQRVM